MTQTDLILLAGFIAVATGFGYRNLLASLVGRIVLLFGRQISEGDRITIAGTEGIVEAINLRCTVLRTLDNVFLYIPNGMWLSSPVVHWSAGGRNRRIRLPVTVPADSDLGRTTTALRRAAEDTAGIAAKPSPRALIVGIGPSGVELELWAWLSESRSIGRTVDELGRNVQEQLRDGGSSRSRSSDSPRSQSSDSSRSRGSRNDRRDRDSNDRPRRSSRSTGERSRDRSNREEVNSAPETDAATTEPKPAEPVVYTPPEPPEPAPEATRNVPFEAQAADDPDENNGSDSGNSEESVSYGRSKRRVPRR